MQSSQYKRHWNKAEENLVRLHWRNVSVGRERQPDKGELKMEHWFAAAEQLKRNNAERLVSLMSKHKGTFEAGQPDEGCLYRLVLYSVLSWSWRRWRGSAGRCGGAVSRYIRLSRCISLIQKYNLVYSNVIIYYYLDCVWMAALNFFFPFKRFRMY